MALLSQRHDPISADIRRAAARGFFDRLEAFQPQPIGEFYEFLAMVAAMSREHRIAYLAKTVPGELPGRISLSGTRQPTRGKRPRSLNGRAVGSSK